MFDAAVPWLLAFATVLLAFGRRLARALNKAFGRAVTMSPRAVLVGQFLVAAYGGYFGGAVGILMVSLWSVGLGHDPAARNPLRGTQIAAIFLSASVLFPGASDALGAWTVLTVLLAGAAAGRVVGARA